MASLLLPTKKWMLLEYQRDLEKRKEDLQSFISELRIEIGKKPRVAAKSEEAKRQIKFQIKKIKDKYNAQKDDYEKKCSNYQHTLEKQVHTGDANYEPLQAAAAAGITKLKILYEVLSLWSRLEAINQIYNAAIEAVNDATFGNAAIPIRNVEQENGWQEIRNTLKERYVKNLCQESLNAFRLCGTNCNLWTIIGDLSTTNDIPDFNDPDCFHILTNHSNDHTFNKRSQTLESYAYLLCRPERHYWSKSGTAYSNRVTAEQESVAPKTGFKVFVQRAHKFNQPLRTQVNNWLFACQGKTSVDASDIQNNPGMIVLPEFIRFSQYRTRSDMQAGFKKMLVNLISCLECIIKSELEGTYSSGNKDVFTPSDTFSVSTEAPMNAVAGVGGRSRADVLISVQKSYKDEGGERIKENMGFVAVEDKWEALLNTLKVPPDDSSQDEFRVIEIPVKASHKISSQVEADGFWHQIYNTAYRTLLTIVTDGCQFFLVCFADRKLRCSRIFQLCQKPRTVDSTKTVDPRETRHMEEDLVAQEATETLGRKYLKDRSIFCAVLLQTMRHSLFISDTSTGGLTSIPFSIPNSVMERYSTPPTFW